jgi:cytochrome c-type biogenesis protein CcmF
VGPPFFNRVNIPIGLMLLALMGIGPVIAWRKASPRNLKRNFTAPLAMGRWSAPRCGRWGCGTATCWLTFMLGAFTMTTIDGGVLEGHARARGDRGEGVGRRSCT